MVVILEGNGLITRGEEGRKEGPRSVHAMPCHAVVSSRISPLPLHPSLFNVVVVVEWECSEGKLERTAGLRRRRRRCRKARSQFRNQIGPPNDRLFARSLARPSASVLRGNVARHVSKREWGLGRDEQRREGGRKAGTPILQRDGT